MQTERSKPGPADSGPAFPYNELNQQTGGVYAQHAGMSLRDWFAGQALMAMIPPHGLSLSTEWERIARTSYKFADAMLAARAQGGAA